MTNQTWELETIFLHTKHILRVEQFILIWAICPLTKKILPNLYLVLILLTTSEFQLSTVHAGISFAGHSNIKTATELNYIQKLQQTLVLEPHQQVSSCGKCVLIFLSFGANKKLAKFLICRELNSTMCNLLKQNNRSVHFTNEGLHDSIKVVVYCLDNLSKK